MKKLFLTAAAAACAMSAPAFAEEAAGWTFSGNIAMTSDYVFRGITQNGEDMATQGGFDAAYGKFYAGVWGSSVNFAPGELDAYVGYKPTFGAVSTDFGIVGYFYPGASDDGAELDYGELYAKASIAPIEPWTVGGAVYYSPEFTGETGSAYYVELNSAYTVTPAFAVSGAVGYQDVEDGVAGVTADNYTTWNLGGTYSVAGFGFDLRYSDTDSDDVGAENYADDRVAFTIKRAL